MKIFLTVVLVLLILVCIIVNIEIDLQLKPNGFISRHFTPKLKNDPRETQGIKGEENRQKFADEAAAWYAAQNVEEMSIKTFDGLTLYGYMIKQKEFTHRWVIYAHGYKTPLENPREYAMKWFEKGFNVLLPVDRAHGKSEGDYITMGWFDRKDFLVWIEKVLEADKDAEIVLHGTSMGGATVMMVTGEKLPSNIKCAIEDCGYTNVFDEFSAQSMNVAHIPPFPLIPLCSLFVKLRIGFWLGEASSVNQVKKSVTPTLFIHGDSDDFVPFEMLDECYNAASCEKEKLVVKGAIHSFSKNVEPELYWKTVFEFAEKHL